MITYEQYKKLVPKETMELVDNMLMYFKTYLPSNRAVQHLNYSSDSVLSINTTYICDLYQKAVCILLYCLNQDEKYARFLSQLGYDEKAFYIVKAEPFNNDEQKSEYFALYSQFFDDPKHCSYLDRSDIPYMRIGKLNILDVVFGLCSEKSNLRNVLKYSFPETKIKLLQEQVRAKNWHDHKEMASQIKEEYYDNFSSSVISYLETTAKVRKLLSEQKNQPDDIVLISLVIAIYYYDTTDKKEQEILQKLLYNNGITLEKIKEKFSIDMDENTCPAKIAFAIKEFYLRYCKEGVNQNIAESNLTVSNILENVFNRDFTHNVSFESTLKEMGCDMNLFSTFQKQLYKVEDLEPEAEQYLENVLKIYHGIVKEKSPNEKQSSDSIYLSFLLGMFTIDHPVSSFLEKNGMGMNHILSAFELKDTFLEEIQNQKIDYHIMMTVFHEYFALYRELEDKSLSSILDTTIDICDGIQISNNSFLESLSSKLGVNYDNLKVEIRTKKDYRFSLPVDMCLSLFEKEPVESLDHSNLSHLLQFGSALEFHSNYIYNNLITVVADTTYQQSLDIINQLLQHIYQTDSKKKAGFFAWIFRLFQKKEDHFIIDYETIKRLQEVVNQNIGILSKELLDYDKFRRYIEIYSTKSQLYEQITTRHIEKVEQELKTINQQENYALFLSATSKLQILRNKQNTFYTSNTLMRQELVKINQAIVSHFVTLNALEVAKNNLIPLIGLEATFINGRKNEKEALAFTNNVVYLFQALLSKDSESVKKTMNQIEKSYIPVQKLESLESAIKVYLEDIKQTETNVEGTKPLEIESPLYTSKPVVPYFEVTEKPKQKTK